MNKKIFAAILGGTMLVAGALSFAGCGHKHDYEIFYRIADCDSEGYTLHTCRDCGYSYADGFVAPLGHLWTFTCHIEEDESAVKSAARGKSAVGSGHYELCVPINADLLEELKEYGKSACIHKECQFCSNPAAFKYYMENYTYEQLVELSKKCISFQDGYDNMSFEEFGTLINEILLMESGFKNIDKNLYDQWEQLYGSPFSSFMPPADAFSDAQHTDEKPMVIAVDAFETGLGRIPGPKTKIECYEYDMLSHMPHGLFEYRRYPIEITMPDTIEEIENNAFGNCATLRRVDLSKNLKIVSDNAFRGAHLTSIIIPKSVKFIGRHAFGFYDKLQAVFFEGSFGDWYEGIEFEDENDGLKKAKVYLYEDNEWYYYNGEPCY